MTQQLHSKALMATVKELMAKHHQNNRDSPTIVMESLHAEDGDSDGKRSHNSSAGSEQCLLSPKSGEEGEARARGNLSLDLTLDSYPSTDSLHVLGELLCDIRRSCTTSLTSTPISSDGEVTGGADAVFESKLRRSEMELRAMGEAHSTK